MEEGGQLLDAVAHVAHVEHPGVPGDEVGDQRLQLAEPQGERRPTDHRTHGHAALPANVGVSDGSRLLVLVGVIHLVAAGPDHRVPAEALTYVQLGPVQHHLHRRVDRHRQVPDQKVRVARALHAADRSHSHPVAVSERHVLVLPRSGLVQLQLTGPKQDLGGLSVDGVPVGVHLISEGVVLALPLEAVKGPLDNQRI